MRRRWRPRWTCFRRFARLAECGRRGRSGWRGPEQGLLGRGQKRSKPLFWHYGYPGALRPGAPEDRSPSLAIREGDWKLLMEPDGTGVELYNLKAAPNETIDLAGKRPREAAKLSASLQRWKESLPRELWR